MSKITAADNFDEWVRAYLVTHPRAENADSDYTYDDMFAAWVAGAIFTADRMYNPTRPHVPPLPDIFQAIAENPTNEPG